MNDGETGGQQKEDGTGRKVTLLQVARMAGVSQATASMVLTGREGVSFARETVMAVLAAAERLDYKGSRHRLGRTSNSPTVLLVTPNVTNPYYSTVVQAVQQAAAAKSFNICLCISYRSLENELAALHFAQVTGVAGIVFAMLAHPAEILARCERKIPMVVIGDRMQTLDVDTVELNNYEAGSLIAHHMYDLGHRRLAYVSTTLDAANPIRVQRINGLKDTFAKLCPEGGVLVKSRDVSPQVELEKLQIEHAVGYELALSCLEDKDITAFVAVNDMVAYGVMDAVREAGFSIPGDYSVCGFDNIFPSRFAGVGLTTVEHYMHDKGRSAFEILYDKINGTASDRNITRVEYRHKLIVRGSTGPARR